jgi:hypothetical protein
MSAVEPAIAFGRMRPLKPKATKPSGGLKLDMDFDEALRHVSKIKPVRRPPSARSEKIRRERPKSTVFSQFL